MYKTIDTKQPNELLLLRQGWINPEFELTDKVYSYGKLTYNGILRRNAMAIAADNTWQFKFGPVFSRMLLITDQSGAIIGETKRKFFSRSRTLTLQNGFRAKFYRPSIWSREWVWESAEYGVIIRMKSYPLQFKDKIATEQSMAPAALIPLLIFLGAHLIILERRRRAAR
jgi:hypothetical protein